MAAMESANRKSVGRLVREIEVQSREEEVLGWVEEISDAAFNNRFGKGQLQHPLQGSATCSVS